MPQTQVWQALGAMVAGTAHAAPAVLVSKGMRQLLGAALAVLICAGAAMAGAQGGSRAYGVPVLVAQVAVALVVQWVVFVHSWRTRSDRLFDLTGALTYISVTVLGLALVGRCSPRDCLLTAMVVLWAGRLGTFLFKRVRRCGGDPRFEQILRSAPRLFAVWTLQGLWVVLTALAAWTALTTRATAPLGAWAAAGATVWVCGWVLEVVADRQKAAFRAQAANQGEFISSGLWSLSRHPNYLGEIVLWLGVALVAAPVLRGWQLLALASPVFVALLLTRVSGVPLLERRADERWGEREDYRRYKASTPVLVPRLSQLVARTRRR